MGGTNLRRLPAAYWWLVGIGAIFSPARFSEAFLILRAEQGGLPLALAPLVPITMNAAYAATVYPFSNLADKTSRTNLLARRLVLLIVAGLLLT
jgi:hypothetical protein